VDAIRPTSSEVTIELDAKAGSTYTIIGDETRHEIIEDAASSSAE